MNGQCEALAKTLLEKETINHDNIVSVLGKRPFDSDAYQDYLKNTRKQQEDFEKVLMPFCMYLVINLRALGIG